MSTNVSIAGNPAVSLPVTRTAAEPRKVSLFARLLHRAYWRGSALSHFFALRLCSAGLALGVVGVVAAMLAMGQPRESVLGLCALSGVLGLAGLVLVAGRRAAVTAVREVPRHGTAGEPLEFSVRVRNVRKRRLARAWLREVPPDPRPTLAEFAGRREPGEERRNLFDRHFAYYRWQWLMTGRYAFAGGDSADELRLPAGGEMVVRIRLTPCRRGIIRLNDLRLLLPDPLSLVQRCRKIPAPPATITVLPRRYPLPPVAMPGSARFQIGGETTSNAIGNTGEFVGLREYRRGDPLRQIHWRSWARTGRPIVKELEDTHFPRYGLVLDTFAAGVEPEVFEDVVSVAASFAATIDTNESLLDMMFVKDQAHLVTAGRGLARAEKLLEVLAAVEPEPVTAFGPLARLVLRHRDDLTSCLVVLAGWDDDRRDFLRRLAAGGVHGIPLIVGRGGRPDGTPGYWLESGHLARDLRALPQVLQPLSPS
ncbi:MAG: DUF58 domain-containing protein [Akkermansiaceae bacterium]|jgi:uncharacterized protein (DUF58 family)|nr:DUF58 domain-containing protein [Akkermansiaceae bacterium]